MSKLLDAALTDLNFLKNKWKNDRKWLFENYTDELTKPVLWSKQCSFWELFTAEQLAEIMSHYKNKEINELVYRFLQNKPQIREEFFKIRKHTKHISYSNFDEESLIRYLDQCVFTNRHNINDRKKALKRNGLLTPRIEAYLYDRSLPFRLRKREHPRQKPQISENDALKAYMEKKGLGVVNQKLVERYGIDGSAIYRKIIKKAVNNKITVVDFCTTKDEVFIELLDFFNLRDYSECLKILPSLAEFLARRASGTKKNLYFPLPIRLENAG